jgi:Skp family chaperone for outer membrane proteins
METSKIEKVSQTNLQKTRQEKLEELHAQQANLKHLQSELDAIESKMENGEELSKDELKFTAELGWLSAAAVAIATVAVSI